MIVKRSLLSLLLFSFLLADYGCSIRSSSPVENDSVPLAQTDSAAISSGPVNPEASDIQRLATLWTNRTKSTNIRDYPIGPGDVLDICLPAIPELALRTVRVTAEGTISLLFIGLVQSGALTEERLRKEIWSRLEKDYTHDSQVSRYVREYRLRQIAILGAVQKPGLYSLNSGAESLLDAISLAGGMTTEAAPRVFVSKALSAG